MNFDISPALFGSVVTVAGVLLSILAAAQWRRFLARRSWPEVQAVVAALETQEEEVASDGSSRVMYMLRATFRFRWNGRERTAVDFDPFLVTAAACKELQERYRPGTTHAIRCNPERPEEIVWRWDPAHGRDIPLLTTTAAFAAAVFALALLAQK